MGNAIFIRLIAGTLAVLALAAIIYRCRTKYRDGRALAGRYRLTKPTIALYPDGLKRICITVAEGAVVEVLAPVSAKTNELIEVKWQERTLSMFKEDIEERGVLTCVDPTSAGNALEDQITGQSWSPPR